jgi:phenylpyruvate tautomerase PptA (4-oxalocrotonate tautomerase family)
VPILKVELIEAGQGRQRAGLAQALADEVGRVLKTPPGRTWVRVSALPSADYAENDAPVSAAELPTFVEVLHRLPPEGDALDAEVDALTNAIARVLDQSPERVHVCYASAAIGRQAFGGRLVR